VIEGVRLGSMSRRSLSSGRRLLPRSRDLSRRGDDGCSGLIEPEMVWEGQVIMALTNPYPRSTWRMPSRAVGSGVAHLESVPADL
jgi:hypothetical protein